MRKRLLLIAAPLLVVAIAASVAVAAPSSAEHSRGPKLDKLHAERPIAASESSSAVLSITDAGFEKAAKQVQDYLTDLQYQELGAYLRALDMQAVVDYIASLQAAEAAQAAAPRRVSSAVSYSSNPGDFLSCVRNRESGGNYGVYNSGGSGACRCLPVHAGDLEFDRSVQRSFGPRRARPGAGRPRRPGRNGPGALRAAGLPPRGAAVADVPLIGRGRLRPSGDQEKARPNWPGLLNCVPVAAGRRSRSLRPSEGSAGWPVAFSGR